MGVRPLLCLIACGLAVTAAAQAAEGDKPPTRTCKQRVEFGSPARFGGPESVIVGRVSFSALARYADPDEFGKVYDARRGHYSLKSGIGVRANRNVKLSIVPAQRSKAGLDYAGSRGRAAPGKQPVVLLAPCRSSQRAFSYDGKVGAVTGFSGGLAVAEPMCLVLEARTRGREPVRRAISLGMGDTCSQP